MSCPAGDPPSAVSLGLPGIHHHSTVVRHEAESTPTADATCFFTPAAVSGTREDVCARVANRTGLGGVKPKQAVHYYKSTYQSTDLCWWLKKLRAALSLRGCVNHETRGSTRRSTTTQPVGFVSFLLDGMNGRYAFTRVLAASAIPRLR